MAHLNHQPIPVRFSPNMLAWASLAVPADDAPMEAWYAQFAILNPGAATWLQGADIEAQKAVLGVDEITDASIKEYIRERLLPLQHFWEGVREVLGNAEYNTLVRAPDFGERLCGSVVIDVDDWQRSTQFATRPAAVTQGQADQAKAIFFAAVRQLTLPEKLKLLEFVTGYTSPPSNGFAGLRPGPFQLCIGEHTMRVPATHTCFNQLVIPRCMTNPEIDADPRSASTTHEEPRNYDAIRTTFMLERLRTAIAGDGSFGMS
jgi:hypothetical protein